tara:strand:- start:6643 stop:7389 length:747 start_codon:yes stop_codon:yes gene_type:complete
MADQLFNDEQTPTPQATPEQPITPQANPNDLFTDQLAAIKNSDGAPKYDSVEKAIEALQHSQQFIPELQSKMTSQETLISELTAKLEASQSVQDIINKQTPPIEASPTSVPTYSEQDIEDKLTQLLEQRSAVTQASTNASTVKTTLTTKYGANAQAEIAAKAKQLGMKPSELGELAKKSPAMVLALFGEKHGVSNPSMGTHVPPMSNPAIEPVKRPDKSVLSGATSKEQGEMMRKIKEEIYRKHGITG